MAAGTEVRPNGDGSFSSAPGGAPAGTPPAGTPAPEPQAKAKVELTSDAKGLLSDALGEAIDALTDALKQVDSSKEVEPDPESGQMPEVPGDLMDLILGSAEQLEDACMAASGYSPEAGEEPAAPAAPGEAPPGAAPEPPAPPGAMGKLAPQDAFKLFQAKRTIAKMEIRKRGARMAKERFNRFHGALGMLSTILGELQASAPGAAAAAKAKKKEPPAPPPGAPAAKSAKEAELEKQNASLNAQLTKALGELQAIKKNVAGSNAAQPEATPIAKGAGGDFSWPMDMNRAHGADVPADESFYDKLPARAYPQTSHDTGRAEHR